MKNIIKKYYNQHKNIKRWKHHLSNILTHSIDYDKFKNDLFNFLKNPTELQIIWHVINNDYTKHTCTNCGKDTKFNIQFFYHGYCSKACTASGTSKNMSENKKIEIVKKRELTNLKKYGVRYISMTEKGKQLKIETCLKKYGVKNPLQNKEVHDRQFKTMQTNNMKKYGRKSTRGLPETNKKTIESKIIKYGEDYSKKFLEKAKKTCIKKYGVEYYTQTEDWYNKYKNHEFGHKYKDYLMPSGTLLRIQGYEDKALNKLLETKQENEIFTGKNITKYTGKIIYVLDGMNKLYMPDIYLKKENKIIEVKSTWTYKIQIDKNNAKAETCRSLGFNFEFWIFDKSGNLTIKS
jgi:hypothetical protein